MSGAPKVRSMNVTEPEVRPVFGSTGNKSKMLGSRKPESKPSRKTEKNDSSSPPVNHHVPSILRKQDLLFHLSLDASCSSDASSESLHSRASTGRLRRSFSTSSTTRPRSSSNVRQRKQCAPKPEKVASDSDSVSSTDCLLTKKRCGWVTPNTDPCYATFHDEEWGVPVHDDKKLFELLVLSGALAELTWPTILSKRHLFREVFADFDPIAVANLNERKITAPGSTASSLLSELKLRAVIDNARQMSKIIDEYGSFDEYIWSFVNHKPIISRFRYSRQVPVKTPKADVISKDLVRRGFRSVSPTVIYSFMQVAGITNDHVTTCFRFQECLNAISQNKEDNEKSKTEEIKIMQVAEMTNGHLVDCFRSQECLPSEAENKDDNAKAKTEEENTQDLIDLGIAKVMDELNIASECRVAHHEGKEEKGLAWKVE